MFIEILANMTQVSDLAPGPLVSNKGQGPLLRGDNYKYVKMGWSHLKIFSSRSTGPILTRLGTNHPWVKGIQVCSKEEDSPSPREIIAEE